MYGISTLDWNASNEVYTSVDTFHWKVSNEMYRQHTMYKTSSGHQPLSHPLSYLCPTWLLLHLRDTLTSPMRMIKSCDSHMTRLTIVMP